jgi:hypothetical protein
VDVPQVEATAAEHKSVAPRVVRPSSTKSLLGLWSSLSSDFYLEVSGERLALWAAGLAHKGTLVKKVTAGSFGTLELRRVLRASYYVFQPITVVLHPPTVCIKTFNLGGSTATQWLTEHLHEVFPPGDRREMRMVHAVCSRDQLLVATVNKGVLNSICQAIWQAGGSIGAIVPAAALDLSAAEPVLDVTDLTSPWTLVQYEYQRNEAAQSIWSSCITPQETRESGTTVNRPHFLGVCDKSPWRGLPTRSLLAQQLDFLPQLRVARPLPTRLAPLILKTSAIAASILLLLTVILYLSGTIYRSTTTAGDKEVSVLSTRVTQLQEHNRELKRQLVGLVSTNSGSAVVGRLLYTIAKATPDDAWLQRLELQRLPDNHTYEFRMSGLSLDDKAPAAFAAALAQSHQVGEAHLSRVGRTNDSVRDRFSSTMAGKATEFDLQGRTRAVDSD